MTVQVLQVQALLRVAMPLLVLAGRVVRYRVRPARPTVQGSPAQAVKQGRPLVNAPPPVAPDPRVKRVRQIQLVRQRSRVAQANPMPSGKQVLQVRPVHRRRPEP